MDRRTLLVSICALSTGCVSGSSRSSPIQSPEEVYRINRLSVTTNTDKLSAKYVLKARRFYSAKAVEKRREDSDEQIVVMDISEVENRDLRQALETAFENEWRSDTLPDGLAELVTRVDFFTGISTSETYSHIGFELYRPDPNSSSPLEFEATVVDEQVASESPGVLTYTLRNTGNEVQKVESGSVAPFGILWANNIAGEEKFLLWRDYKEDDPELEFTDEGIISPAIQKITELNPGESVSRQYEILPGTTTHHPDRTVPLGPGDYRTRRSLTYYEEQGQPESKISFDVEFTLETVTEKG